MNIGLDARAIFSLRPRGTGRNLCDAYRLAPELRPHWQFTLYHQRRSTSCPLVSGMGREQRCPPWPANVRARRLDVPGDRVGAWLHVALPLAAWADRIDLLHFPAGVAPRWCPVPMVVTIHDLIPLKVAEETSPGFQRRFRRHVMRAVRRAQHIITPSRATRDELCAEFNLSAERVTVIPWAPDAEIAARLAESCGRRDDGRYVQTAGTPCGGQAPTGRYDGDGWPPRKRGDVGRYATSWVPGRPWLLNFSGSSARKNAARLMEAWAMLTPELRRRYLLVLVGCASAARRAELETLAARLGIAADCRILGFVPHEDLPGLLGGATALLMPSLGEGFGLPILDAFAAGVPVLTSQCSSLPEVAGEAAVYCDPHSPASIADGIARVLEPQTARRLVQAGRARVAEFTWQRTAAAMCGVYERCLAASRAGRPVRRPGRPAPPVGGRLRPAATDGTAEWTSSSTLR